MGKESIVSEKGIKTPNIPIGNNIHRSPVEERGYKNILNLPDWPMRPIIKEKT